MRCLFRIAALAAAVVAALQGQPKTIQPVALVLEANGGALQRHDRESSLALTAGQIVFAGDVITTGASQTADIAFCPGRTSFRLDASSSASFTDRRYRVRGRASGSQAQVVCVLPAVRADNNGGDDYGISLLSTAQGENKPVGTFEARLAALDPPAREQLRQSLAPVDARLADHRADALARLARASILERFGLYYDAGRDFRQAAQLLGNPAWIAPLRNTADARGVQLAAAAPAKPAGATYAMAIGISEFANLPANAQLMYAHEDAYSFGDFLKSDRGGKLREGRELRVLTNQDANLASIENGLANFLIASATASDTVILFIATHGVIEPKTDDPYLLASDSDLEQLATTALPMSRILELLDSPRCRAARVLIFIDSCHAGRVGDFRSRFGGDLERILRSGHSGVFAFSASHASEQSEEDARYGGGHGAFSYFLLRGLNTSEPNEPLSPKPSAISLKMLVSYVQQSVSKATAFRQNPNDMGALDRSLAIVPDLTSKGIGLLPYPTTSLALAHGPSRGIDLPASERVRRFRQSIDAGRLLPGEADSAFDMLAPLRAEFGEDRIGYLAEENRLRVALENQGQRVILQYLKGEEVRQPEIEFDRGAQAFRAAFQLTPEAHPLLAKALFCEGRALTGRHRYADALIALERAAALQPAAAYVWNALGLVYLEQPDYDRAVRAFEDSIRLAPFWAYPRHNLALARRELGDLAGAIREYRNAIPLAPDFSYLHYNLGLLYQQINDPSAAGAEYREAYTRARSDSTRARIRIAEAVLVSGRDPQAAVKLFDQALALHPDPEDLLVLRYNRAMLVETNDPAAAQALWLANLAQRPDHLPTLLAFAEALDRWGEANQAIDRFSQIVDLKPDYVAARIRLASLIAASDPEKAIAILEDGLRLSHENPQLLERMGDIQADKRPVSVRAYCGALKGNIDREFSRRLLDKLKRLGVRGATGCPAL